MTEENQGVLYIDTDIDFADDVRFLSHTKHQEKTEKLTEKGNKLGIWFNQNKSKDYENKNKSDNRIQVNKLKKWRTKSLEVVSTRGAFFCPNDTPMNPKKPQ